MQDFENYLNSKRKTTVAVFDAETNNEIKKLVKSHYCKTPVMMKERNAADTLPFHFTLREMPGNLEREFDVSEVGLGEARKGGWNLHLRTIIHETNYHITLSVFETHEEAQKEFDECSQKFKPFRGKIESIRTYEIYPAKLLSKFLISSDSACHKSVDNQG